MTSIIIPDSVTSIGENAFVGCEDLKKVYISDIAAWCNINFRNEYANPMKYADELYLNDKLLTELVIPEGITSIGKYTFQGCSNLKSIVIPDGVTSIGDNAFAGCSNLKSIVIPDGVTSIGDNAFVGCSNLKSIVIPDGVTSIGDNTFEGCSNLKSIVIPDSITSIGDNAFAGCSNLESIVIPDSVTSIGNNAFEYCRKLTSIAIPDSITIINNETFLDCSSLESVTISENITAINDSAFRRCDSLTDIIYGGSAKEWNSVVIGVNNTSLLLAQIHCQPSYGVVKEFDENMGSVSITKNGIDVDESRAGVELIVEAVPNDGYMVTSIEIEDADGNDIKGTTTTDSFLMPEEVVVVRVTFDVAPVVSVSENDSDWDFEINMREKKENYYIYVAVYDESSVMISVKKLPIKIQGVTRFSIDKVADEYLARVFIWTDTLEPVLERHEILLGTIE